MNQSFAQSPIQSAIRSAVQANDIYNYFIKNVKISYGREERIVHVLMGIILLAAVVMLAVNHWVMHYTTESFSLGMILTLPIFAFWWLIGKIHSPQWPRFGLVATCFANVGMAAVIFLINWGGMLTTPFVMIDYHIVQWDHWLGFNVTHFMAWAYQFPTLIKVLNFAYDTWETQLLLTPLLLALLKRSRELNQYFIASAIFLIICNIIYYFFPTVAPAGVYASSYFTQGQHDLVTRFYEIHQSLPITAWGGGIISFPSGHVLYALLGLYVCRSIKWVFYPLIILNSLLIIATLALGYHYLSDVIASFVIAAIVLSVMRLWLYPKTA